MKPREEIRQQLWVDVYLSSANKEPGLTRECIKRDADNAVKKFDEQFPKEPPTDDTPEHVKGKHGVAGFRKLARDMCDEAIKTTDPCVLALLDVGEQLELARRRNRKLLEWELAPCGNKVYGYSVSRERANYTVEYNAHSNNWGAFCGCGAIISTKNGTLTECKTFCEEHEKGQVDD